VQRERGSRLLSALEIDPALRDSPKQSLETGREKSPASISNSSGMPADRQKRPDPAFKEIRLAFNAVFSSRHRLG
jgi:hypothetical protein